MEMALCILLVLTALAAPLFCAYIVVRRLAKKAALRKGTAS